MIWDFGLWIADFGKVLTDFNFRHFSPPQADQCILGKYIYGQSGI